MYIIPGKFNDISEDLKNELIPQFRDGEVVRFRLQGGKYEPATGLHSFGATYNIVLKDRIKDKDGRYKEIGVPDQVDGDHVTRVKKFRLEASGYGRDQFLTGDFSLTRGNIEHDEIIDFLFLSNRCGTRKGRDESQRIEWVYVNEKVEAKTKARAQDKKFTAMMEAHNMGAEAQRSFAAGMNWDVSMDPDILITKIREYAENNPVDFLKRTNDPAGKLKGLIKGALDKDIIRYTPDKHAFVWGDSGVVVGKLDRDEEGKGLSTVDLIAKWLGEAKNGGDMEKAIKNKYNATLRELAKGDE